ncbi:MAG TPA: sugar ABC transporter substrate-binding protein [Actinocrinis sp.]|jgi:multiple sugar transport system substrate-binding protein
MPNPRPRSRRRPPRRFLGTLLAALTLAAGAACSSGVTPSGGPTSGVTITMWTRAGTQSQTQALVTAYNKTHSNHVVLTVYPNEQYPAKIASAAGAHALPDIFTSDVVFAPNYVAQGLWADVTSKFDALPFKNDVVPSFIRAGTSDGKLYAIPHALDLSVMYYNKTLYQRAGLNPDDPPKTLAEYASQARAIAKLGGGVYGSYEGGNCGGCVEFTMWPSIWAGGGQVMNAAGTKSTIDSPQAAAVFGVYRSLFADGTMAPAAKQEDGTTWLGALENGNIGIAPGPFSWYSLLKQKGLDMGVAPIPGVNGGQSTFIGGDVAGISATSGHQNAAWDFLSWTLSEQAQVGVMAKGSEMIARTDLENNQYAKTDPNVLVGNEILSKGETPYALNFNATYNDPQSPWTTTLRGALFGPDLNSALASGQASITTSLQQQ